MKQMLNAPYITGAISSQLLINVALGSREQNECHPQILDISVVYESVAQEL